jgi:hypothetical protein
MFTLTFWKAAFERAVKTFAQVALSYFVIGTTGLLELDWVALGSVAGAGAVASVLTSIVSAAATDGSPSLTSAEKLDPTSH